MDRPHPNTTSMHAFSTLYASLFLMEESIKDAKVTLDNEEYEEFVRSMLVAMENALGEGYGNVKMV